MARAPSRHLSTLAGRTGLVITLVITAIAVAIAVAAASKDKAGAAATIFFAVILVLWVTPMFVTESGPAEWLVRALIKVSRPFVRKERFLVIALDEETDPEAIAKLEAERDELNAKRSTRKVHADRLREGGRRVGSVLLVLIGLAFLVSAVLAWKADGEAWLWVLVITELVAVATVLALYLIVIATAMFEEPLVTAEQVLTLEAEATSVRTDPYATVGLGLFVIFLGYQILSLQ